MSRVVLGDGLIRAHELADLAALARSCGKAARRFGLCAFSVKGRAGRRGPGFLG
jgi:hypothetical protein